MSDTILVIEDNQDNMKLFQWTLEDAGYEFTGVASAEEGLALLEKQAFDLVVMDISLPGMDGKEATRQIRSDPKYESIPVVAATAHAVKEEKTLIRASGVSDMIIKPIDEEIFLKTIQNCLDEVKNNNGQSTRR